MHAGFCSEATPRPLTIRELWGGKQAERQALQDIRGLGLSQLLQRDLRLGREAHWFRDTGLRTTRPTQFPSSGR